MEYNEAQAEAIYHREGPMLVVAGPGSGKTFVITERIRHLTEVCGVRPEELLVITFTRAAAREMRNRYTALKGNGENGVTFGTFHSVFFGILRSAYGFTAENIAREEQRVQILREIIRRKETEIADEADLIREVLSEISVVKNDQKSLKDYEPSACRRELFLELFCHYEKRMHQMRLMDFDDLLVYCHELFSKRPDILAAWQNRFRYVLVDEFQDVNRLQYEVTRMLCEKSRNLFAVGDDDQSIYQFRGAKPEIMLNFRKDYPDAAVVQLDINYRSQANITERALCLVHANTRRFPKEIRSARAAGEPVCVKHFRNVREEAMYLLSDIRRELEQGTPPGEIAVLYRTASLPRTLLEKMMEYNLPFCLKEGMPDIYRHWIARDLISYIHLAMGSRRREDFLTVMNRPNRYISRDAVNASQITFSDLKEYYREMDWMCGRLDAFQKDIRLLSKLDPYAGIQYIRHGIGYEAYVRAYAKERGISEEELMEVLECISESAKESRDYEAWFEHIREYQEEWKEQMLKKKEQQEAVSFLTMHGSKGLEFQTVYILEANEGITPHKKAVTEEELEEERRMFYVAMTRAKDRLMICSVEERFGRKLMPSRFLAELSFDRNCLKEGTRVIHRTYGAGTVLLVQKDRVEIFFEASGKRRVMNLSYCLQNGLLRTAEGALFS